MFYLKHHKKVKMRKKPWITKTNTNKNKGKEQNL